FIGYQTTLRELDNLYFTTTFDDTAAAAVALDSDINADQEGEGYHLNDFAPGQRYLRGLYSGGTLAYEAQLILEGYLPTVYSNAPIKKEFKLANSLVSQEHTIVDLGEDEFTVGRLHPMMDNELRLKRLAAEAEDPETALILLDVVLGYGSHPDPASELAPGIASAKKAAEKEGRHLEVVITLSGTETDPQGRDAQLEKLKEAGAKVFLSSDAAVRYAGKLAAALNGTKEDSSAVDFTPVDLATLSGKFSAINVGLDSFTESLKAQDAEVVQVDWKPAAGGNTDMMALLEKMKG
ncbi:MAG: acyl-CoA synthetase FdrA, partial [Anaerolineales bacterium]